MKLSAWLVPILCGLSSTAAQAELGGKGNDLASESSHLKARLQARSGAAVQSGVHNIFEMALSDGTIVRQFTRADGTIFAVSWKGSARPDLKTLFGDYFDRFQADNSFKDTGTRRRALSSTHDDFVVRSFGGNGEVSGFAVLPKLMPKGFDLKVLQ